jgi:hypothetical protein
MFVKGSATGSVERLPHFVTPLLFPGAHVVASVAAGKVS